MTKSTTPYRDHAQTYLDLGWKPLPVTGKHPPVDRATGYTGTVTVEQVADWSETHGDWNVGLRLEGVVAIDVDEYGSKVGGQTLAALEARLGPLRPTFRSTSRGFDNPSGQRFYRVPEGAKLVTAVKPDIEIVQWFHRYSVVWPTVHPDTGKRYQWYDSKGVKSGPPHIDELPDLPEAWWQELQRAPHAPLQEGVDIQTWRQLLASFPVGEPCLSSSVYRKDVEQSIATLGKVGHDEAMTLALRGFMLGREGHAGLGEHLTFLREQHQAYVASQPGRDRTEVDRLFRDMAETAQRKVIEDECRCPKAGELADADLVGVVDPDLAIVLASPTLLPNRAVDLRVAALQFTHDHPVRRHRGSDHAIYLWTGDRWEVANVAEYVYRWLALKANTDFTGRKADELTRYIITHAPWVTDRDLDTRYISCENGLLDWRTGELKPRTRDVFVVNHVPHKWRPEATPGRFLEWIASAIEPAQHGVIWEILGYALSPIHDLKFALALTGPGGGGKSTFINVLTNLVGSTNCAAVSPADLGKQFTPFRLFGKTVNAAGDVGSEAIENLGMFKAIVAGDEIDADRKHKDGVLFRPRAFTLASFNVLPKVAQSDSAFWDRWLVLGFQKRFVRAGKPDNYYRDRMPYDERLMEGVLVAAVQGLQRLRERGGFDQDVFGPAKTEWRKQVDAIAAFVDDHLVMDRSGIVSGSRLYAHYKAVADDSGNRPKSIQQFYAALEGYLGTERPGRVERSGGSKGVAVTWTGFRVYVNRDELHDGALAASYWGSNGYSYRV